MRKQFDDMRTDYQSQLDLIEKAFYDERYQILKRNEDEIKALFDEHKKMEEYFLKKRQDDEEYYSKQLEELRTKDANEQAE
mmetsp:Transcript_45775/g.33481  ORF Transcript_45775/g.33481 Transcript_45775/m.33481 type:complete len:81 (+) Transcript_45775:462-704(+)